MRFEFTPAAERALAVAAGWTSSAGANELHVPEVLVGLLAEPECRAALLLAHFDVDPAAVRQRFSNLTTVEPLDPARATHFSNEFLACLHAAESLLIEHPRPLVLATEHLLLGIVAAPNEVSAWLRERGLLADELEAEVHRLSGHRPGPLPLEPGDDTFVDAEVVDESMVKAGGDKVSRSEQVAVLRIMDAAANRSSEGLRVIEDYLRFALDDRHLTAHCKSIRHELATALDVLSADDRHAARDTPSDVGTDLTLTTEHVRAGTTAVVQANFKRVEQSLRSLEEFSKTRLTTSPPATAAQLEQLRYRVYTLERAVDLTRSSLERLADARLYVLVDARASAAELAELAESLVAAGVPIIQLRDKALADRQRLARAHLLVDATRGTRTLFVMNDRPDLALLCGADGVHLGQEDLSVKDARRVLGPSGLIGVSTHSLEQARAAVLDGANYIGVGPTFPSGTKQFSEFTGIELLRSVQAEIRLPAFAIGGIMPESLPQVLAAGFRRIAVSGAVAMAPNPAAVAKELLAALDGIPEQKSSL